jgi:hypothetical protein
MTKRAQEKRQKSAAPAPAASCGKSSGEKSAVSVAAEIRRHVFDNAGNVLDAVINKANEGSYQHAKFLFELAGLFPAPAAADEEADDSLAAYVLRRLDMQDTQARDEAKPHGKARLE